MKRLFVGIAGIAAWLILISPVVGQTEDAVEPTAATAVVSDCNFTPTFIEFNYGDADPVYGPKSFFAYKDGGEASIWFRHFAWLDSYNGGKWSWMEWMAWRQSASHEVCITLTPVPGSTQVIEWLPSTLSEIGNRRNPRRILDLEQIGPDANGVVSFYLRWANDPNGPTTGKPASTPVVINARVPGNISCQYNVSEKYGWVWDTSIPGQWPQDANFNASAFWNADGSSDPTQNLIKLSGWAHQGWQDEYWTNSFDDIVAGSGADVSIYLLSQTDQKALWLKFQACWKPAGFDQWVCVDLTEESTHFSGGGPVMGGSWNWLGHPPAVKEDLEIRVTAGLPAGQWVYYNAQIRLRGTN